MIERLYEARYLLLSAILAGVALYWLIQAARARWRDYKIERRMSWGPGSCEICGGMTEGGTLCNLHRWGVD